MEQRGETQNKYGWMKGKVSVKKNREEEEEEKIEKDLHDNEKKKGDTKSFIWCLVIIVSMA